MTTCIVALVISCTNTAPRLTPTEAVRVLTNSVAPYVAPLPLPDAYALASRAQVIPHDPAWPFLTPPTPTAPLAPPWRVTTVITTNHGVQTYFNGRNMR
jgi:hypothetical protein